MSCFEMVEERPVTSGRLNLGGREVVSSITGKILITRPATSIHRAGRRVFMKHFLTDSFEAIWMTGDRVVG